MRCKDEYVKYINDKYSAENLTKMLVDVSEKIEATVLNISKYDYDPQGASAVLLIAEEPEALVAHLDKSHLTVHTYPEHYPNSNIATFRVDIDIATCGEISPLSTLNYLIGGFNSDIITLDYKVRGFTRSENGKKLYIDSKLNSIQDYIEKNTLLEYNAIDINFRESNIYHTRMVKKAINLNTHLFNMKSEDFLLEDASLIKESLQREMEEIYMAQIYSN
jgi:S-adenosylmethionine decarboxylase